MAEAHFFAATCRGSLSAAERSVEIAFTLTCSREGGVTLNIDDIPMTAETFWLHEVFNDASSTAPHALELVANDAHGQVVTSKTVYLTTCGTRTDRDGHSWVTLAAMAVWLQVTDPTFDIEASSAGMSAAYYAIGLRGFGTHQVQTRGGRFALLAKHTVDNYDEISGRFDIQAPEPASPVGQWLQIADEVALDMLDVISFAEGRLIRWSVRRLMIGSHVVATEFRGPSRTGEPRRGFYHWLDIQPVLELAARSYTPELKSRTGIDVALEWSLMNPRYSELDFVACVTALEHLADVYEKKNKKTVPPGRPYFDSTIEPALKTALAALLAEAPDENAIAAINKTLGKLRDLTRSTLQDAIERMLTGYGVPFKDLASELPGLIKLRNSIVHEGIARKEFQPRLQQHVNVIRELLTRIFLTLLTYSGSYYSYLNGEKFVPFPPSSDAQATGEGKEPAG